MTVTVTSVPVTSPPDKFGGDPVAFDAAMQAHLAWQSTAIPQMNSQNVENNAINDNINAQHADLVAKGLQNAAANALTATAQATAAASSAATASAHKDAAAGSATSAAASATSAGAAGTAAANVLISAVTQRPRITPSLSVDWTLKPTAAALTAAGWTIARTGEITSLGMPTKAAENLIIRSQDFANAAWVKELATVSAVTDESGLVGSRVIATAGAGAKGIYRSTTGINIGAANYRIRFLCKSAEYTKCHISDLSVGRAGASFDLATGATIGAGHGAGFVSHSITPHEFGGGLYWCELVMTSSTAGTGWAVCISGYPDSGVTVLNGNAVSYTGDGTSGIEVYAAQLQQGFDGDYIPTTTDPITLYEPQLVTTAANELAYQHNDSGECIGLVQYPADTNLILQSQDLGNGSWSKTNVDVTASKRKWAGSVPFWRIARSAASDSARLTQNATTSVAAGANYSATVALLGDRWSNTTSMRLAVTGVANGATGSDASVSCVILSGPGSVAGGSVKAVSGLSFDTPTLVRVTRNYPLADTSTGLLIYPGESASTTIGAAILATRVHLSDSPRLMPYIPTTTAAVTRGAQSLVHNTAGALANPQQGTLVSRMSVEDAVFSDNGTLQLFFGPPAGGAGGAVQIDTTAAVNVPMGYAITFGNAQATCIAPTVRLGLSPVTSAFAYATNSFQAAFGGELTTADALGVVPPTVRLVAGSGVKGLLQRTELYPRAFAPAELAAITTPGVL